MQKMVIFDDFFCIFIKFHKNTFIAKKQHCTTRHGKKKKSQNSDFRVFSKTVGKNVKKSTPFFPKKHPFFYVFIKFFLSKKQY